VPEHMVEAVTLIETDGTTTGFTVMVILFDVDVMGEAQVTVELISQFTTSPFSNPALIYVVLLAPTFPPLSFH
jgi:hypothetical protein